VSGAIQRFIDASRSEGLDPAVRRSPQGTRTAEDAARAIGCDVGQIVKSLVFIAWAGLEAPAGDRPVLALTSGANRVDPTKLAALCGVEVVRRASPEEARAATGFAVAGTPPFGHRERSPAFVDRDLLLHEVVWAAAGTPDAVFPLSPADLVRVSRGTVADLAERVII
jgi:prolyl-tRNA editing enzyme YbaK/EbsC (Cys-tRNA(Pro) deacylase)